MGTVRHDGGRDDGQSASTKNDKHDHGIGSLSFVGIECLEFGHGFESHRSGGVVESEHVGCEIHEHGAIDRVFIRNLGEDAAEEGCYTARKGVDDSSLLPDIENTHPKCEYACESK